MKRRLSLFMAVLLLLAAGVSVAGCGSTDKNGNVSGETVTYYVAADEVAWDYAPSDMNLITGEAFSEEADVFVANGPARIGKVYLKALYREYTDDTFTTLKPLPPEWEHLGTLGPLLRAEVGDTIKVVFKNNTSFPASMHPHGVFYEKDSEGAPYVDYTPDSFKLDDSVQPGGTWTYEWPVPERAGPGEMDPSSIMWMYHSHVDEPKDTNSGLIGPIIVTRKGEAGPNGVPKDVDREFVTMFTIFDENDSWLLDKNIQAYVPGGAATTEADLEALKADPDFTESNLMHSINGFVYGNLPRPTMNMDETVRWYVMGMGNEVDIHTPHWHGQTVLWNMMRVDVVELLPASMKTVDMVPDNPGTWLYHCHVNDHIKAGMIATFTVNE